MKRKKSAISILLAAAMLIGCLCISAAPAAAVQDNTRILGTGNATAYNLPDNIQDGNIFHAFTWRFTDVTKYIKEIASQGFGAVQVSPVQGTAVAETDNAASYMIDWWKYYQPVNFSIGNGLGTKEDFTQMCQVAEEYGIKIIVDVVANHMAQGSGGTLYSKSEQIPADLRDDPSCWHSVREMVSDGSRYDMTQKSLNGLPDLNTASPKVQSYVKNLLKECIEAGADGFRFDAAKHIELPASIDGASGSDFWPNITSYAKSLKPDVYLYGEILNTAGTSYSNYTQYIKITDSGQGSDIRSAIKSNNSSTSLVAYNCSGASAGDLVTWVESHDNFCDKTSTNLTHQQLLLGWGVAGARKDAAALYFCRPEHERVSSAGFIDYDEMIGGPGSTLWQDKTVGEVNKFRNCFAGQSETVASSGSQFYVQRGTSGMVITNFSSGAASINYSTSMADGTYKDQVSGNTFTVSGGRLTGSVPAKAVAVIYNKTETTPSVQLALNGQNVTADTTTFTGKTTGYYTNNHNFTTDTATLAFTLEDAVSGTYSIDGGAPVSFTGAETITIGNGIASNTAISVVVTATDGVRTTEETYQFVKKLPSEKLVAYFDATGYETWSNYCCFVKDINGNAIGAYPGITMTNVEGNIYKAEITGVTGACYVKFNEGQVSTGLDGRTIPPTVINYGTAANAANREKGGFLLNGSMIWQNGEWKDYGYKTSGSPVGPTNPSRPTEDPQPQEQYMLGDADNDGQIKVADALLIQRYIANMQQMQGKALLAADVTQNNKIETADVLEIQKYVAGMFTKYEIGKYFGTDTPTPTNPTAPTVPTTPTSSTDPADTITLALNQPQGWGSDIYAYLYNESGEENAAWPGQAMEGSGTTYKITIPATAGYTKVIFSDTPMNGTDEGGNPYTAVRMQSPSMDVSGSRVYDIKMITVTANNLGFTPTHCYCYNPSEDQFAETGKWPGLEVSGNSILIPAGTYTKAIFNNGTQQQEIDITGGVVPPDPQPGDTITVYFSNGQYWDNVYMYAWRASDENKNAEWPGLPMEPVGQNGYGETIYRAEINLAEFDYIIFNNGSGAQTQDIAISAASNNMGYYCDTSSQNEQGHYAYGTYPFDPSFIV